MINHIDFFQISFLALLNLNLINMNQYITKSKIVCLNFVDKKIKFLNIALKSNLETISYIYTTIK